MSLLMAVALAVAVSACDSGDSPFDGDDDDPQSRTVLVYVVANNSLGTSMGCDEADFKEMVEAAQKNDFGGGRLLVYHNPPRCSATKPCQLYEVTAEGLQPLKSYTFTDAGESVTPERMREVMADMKEFAPAVDYGLVFWSHADNWLGNNGDSDTRYRGFGDDGGKRMSIPTLARALAGEHFAFIYFDCCLLGNVEVLYELRAFAPLAVASPTELGIDGMPYHKNVPVMFDGALTDEEKCVRMAENTFNYYKNHRAECSGSSVCAKTDECQMTVVRLDNLGKLADATRRIMLTVDRLPSSLASLQSYSAPRSDDWGAYDMDDYMALLTSDDSVQNGAELLAEWRAALDDVVVYKEASTRGINNLYISRYCGLGSFAMTSVTQSAWRSYDTLQWWADVVSKAPVFSRSASN